MMIWKYSCNDCGNTIDIKKIFPSLTVDIIIEVENEAGELGIVLIERKNPPHGWALPGGFVDYGETVENAAIREAEEETGLAVTLKGMLGVYSAPERDPRFHTVSIVYVAHAKGELKAGDDAGAAKLLPVQDLPVELAFDHTNIVTDYLQWRNSAAEG